MTIAGNNTSNMRYWTFVPTAVLIGWVSAFAQPGPGAQQVRKDAATDTTTASSRVGSAQWQPWLLGTQINVIAQHVGHVRSPYAGQNSLGPNPETEISHAYGVYAGVQAGSQLQAYLDVEMIRGQGIYRATGLAGVTNGDVIRQGSVDLGSGPYVARAFVRYTVPLSSETRDTLARGQDQIPSIVSSNRVELSAGKLAATDFFDLNRYANTTRWQFMNWGLFQNTAWDFAADTRGYTNGVAMSWIHPLWTLRMGIFQMPTLANGNKFDSDLRRAHGSQAELTIVAPRTATIIRGLAFLNQARMGSYADALARVRVAGAVPDIVADDRPGRTKYGYGLNIEQPVSDSGETGLFARLGWSDGRNESFAFTEVDRHASAGLQLSGAHWGRKTDRAAIAGLYHGIVALHQDYLAAGGSGFLLGDGGLTYGPEEIVEAYYRCQLGDFLQIGPDVQLIRSPGYNRARGPAMVTSFRVNFRY
jgi:high affinity Mn2+ porin